MPKQFKNFLLKILSISTLIVVIFNIGDNLINANKSIKNTNISNSQNSLNFKKINSSSLGKTGVAITTNIGTIHNQKVDYDETIYKDIFSISQLINNNDTANDEIIGKNMQSVEEYRNVLKTNIKQLIDSSNDKPIILNAFIEQLEFRYVVGSKNIKKLNDQKNSFKSSMDSIASKVASLKQKVERDFVANDSKSSLENIEEYLELKKQYYYARTYIIYINHFLAEYSYLNRYNKQFLDTLINNKDALIKDSYIVIPDSGTNLLRNFDLIYSEKEFKEK